MLVLERDTHQSIWIGDTIKVTIVKNGATVRVGIEAPLGIPILRDELVSVADREKREEKIRLLNKQYEDNIRSGSGITLKPFQKESTVSGGSSE